ncbi:HipA N-terminal domain-containing protein [Pusillimonas sp.]|uniref:HipA N-terminal domain-containing protein n=1 Tax=Pusillimonas sp. TaxID=3040095 RepID=UPI0037CB5A0B
MADDVSTLTVRLYDEAIGTLTHVGGERSLFAFNEAYINAPDRPTLSLSFKDTLGQLLTDFKPYRIKLMPFFSNLLPEGHLRKYLAKAALPRKLVMDTTQETVALFMQRWAGEKNHLPMDKDVRLAIDKHLQTLPIMSA